MPNTMTLISTVTVSTAAIVDITSIPSTYTDLVCKVSLRSSNTANPASLIMRLNGTVSGYSDRFLNGSGSTVSSASYSGNGDIIVNLSATPGSFTANTFSSIEIYIPNYTSSSNKCLSIDAVTENNASQSYQTIQASLWSNSAVVNALRFAVFDGGERTLASGSTISLYGITKGSGGATPS